MASHDVVYEILDYVALASHGVCLVRKARRGGQR